MTLSTLSRRWTVSASLYSSGGDFMEDQNSSADADYDASDIKPEIVMEIGRVVIEFNLMERWLAHALTFIIDADDDVADAIYFTPKSNTGRIEMLRNVANTAIPGEHRQSFDTLCKRAIAICGRRHETIHSIYSREPDIDGGEAFRALLPKGEPIGVDLAQLRSLTKDIRDLVSDLFDFMEGIRWIVYDPAHG